MVDRQDREIGEAVFARDSYLAAAFSAAR